MTQSSHPSLLDPAWTALVVHDLKNALGALEAELATLSTASTGAIGPDPAWVQAGATRAHHHCAGLRQRFIQFLTLYAAGDGLPLHCEDEAPRDLLETLIRAQAEAAAGQGPAPDLVLGPATTAAPPCWIFDRHLVRMALEAALHNARRFARKRVELSAHEQEGWLVYRIDDDGPGLGPADTSPRSTGLGTRLCQAVAGAHRSGPRHGRVALFDREGGGARFELWLP